MLRLRPIHAFLLCLALAAPTVRADTVARASDLLGHAVATPDGLEVGTVRDLAIDANTGRIVYVVVSVGSFLIENNLIAVAPDALVPSGAADGLLWLEADADALLQAQRFATNGTWPARADVRRSSAVAASPRPPPASTSATPPEASPSGTATITSATRSAHLSASERTITEKTTAPKPAASASKPALPPIEVPAPGSPFERLDRDHDGVLNRSEFAHEMSRTDSFSKIDANANGVIEPGEYEAFAEAKR